MVFRKISQDVRDRAIDLCHQGFVPQDICDLLGISSRSLSRWGYNQDVYGTSLPPPTNVAGQLQILVGEQDLSICEQLDRAQEMYLDEIQDWIALTVQTATSRGTLSTLIQDAEYSFKVLQKTVSEQGEEERATFRRWARDTVTAEMVVTVGESNKDNRTIFRHWGQSAEGTPAGIRTRSTRGEQYDILAAISVDGYVATRVVIGAVSIEEFFDFIVSEVLPSMNPFPEPQSVLILDDCDIHKSKIMQEIVEANGCVLKFLPPHSPDMNPIEESFALVKAWIRHNWVSLVDSEAPIADLYNASAVVTAEKATQFFYNSGYQTL